MEKHIESIIYPSGLVLTNTGIVFDNVGSLIVDGECVTHGQFIYNEWITTVIEWHKTIPSVQNLKVTISDIEQMNKG